MQLQFYPVISDGKVNIIYDFDWSKLLKVNWKVNSSTVPNCPMEEFTDAFERVLKLNRNITLFKYLLYKHLLMKHLIRN